MLLLHVDMDIVQPQPCSVRSTAALCADAGAVVVA
jgi:hypothetical protein